MAYNPGSILYVIRLIFMRTLSVPRKSLKSSLLDTFGMFPLGVEIDSLRMKLADIFYSGELSDTVESFDNEASKIGLNMTEYRNCIESGKYASKVKSDQNGGASAGVTGTPGTFIYENATGNHVLIPGALPYAQVQAMIDQVLG